MMKEQALNDIDIGYSHHNSSTESLANSRIEVLRQCLNDENYIHAAVQRLALIMSKQLMEITKEGGRYERKRRK